jgi:hypothetical protein
MSLDMLWPNNAEKMVQDSFRRAKWEAESARQREAEERLAILEDDWEQILWEQIRRIYRSPKILASVRGLVSTEHNVLKRIGSELSTVYKWAPIRNIKDRVQDGIARQLWAEMDIDATLEQANLYTNVLRDILLVPWVFDGRMRLDIITPDRFSVIQHPECPTEAVAYWWERTAANTPGRNEIEIVYVDAQEWRVYDAGGTLKSYREHGLNRIPVVAVHADKRRDTWFGGTQFRDVVKATKMIGVRLTMLGRLQYLQSELQIVYKGDAKDIATGQSIGGDTIWAGPGDYSLLNLQADPQVYISVIQKEIEWIARQYGLSASFSTGATSGAEIRLARIPLLEQREKQKKIWRPVEHDLLRLTGMVSTSDHPTLKLDSMSVLTLDYQDEPNTEDPEVQNRVWEGRVKLGVMSQVDVLQQLNSDLTREQAVERLKQITAEREIWIESVKRLGAAADPGAVTAPQVTGAEGGRASGVARQPDE